MKSEEHPKIKFIYDQGIDAKNAISFVSHHNQKEGLRFLKMFLPDHIFFITGADIPGKEKKKVIENFVTDYYEKNEKALKKGFASAIKDWERVEEKYFSLVAELFKNHPWPRGDYTGFGTIFWCYPRFVSERIFLFPLNHRIPHYANKVIGHEMLHFMFFSYIKHNYKLEENGQIKGKESNYVWRVSEAFNSVIEGWPKYQKIFKITPQPYQETMEIYKKMNTQWRKDQDIEHLLDNFIGV